MWVVRGTAQGCPGTRWDRSLAHLGTGVHEDEVLTVQPQEAGAGQGQLAHSKHHVDSVAKERQLAHGLWGRR